MGAASTVNTLSADARNKTLPSADAQAYLQAASHHCSCCQREWWDCLVHTHSPEHRPTDLNTSLFLEQLSQQQRHTAGIARGLQRRRWISCNTIAQLRGNEQWRISLVGSLLLVATHRSGIPHCISGAPSPGIIDESGLARANVKASLGFPCGQGSFADLCTASLPSALVRLDLPMCMPALIIGSRVRSKKQSSALSECQQRHHQAHLHSVCMP